MTDHTYTTDDLLAMEDDRFAEVVTEDLQATARSKSPFQHKLVIQRTLFALTEKLWFVDAQLERQAEDPTYPVERYQKTLAFRRHILAVIDMTERRLGWMTPPTERIVQAWRQLLHEVCDEIEGTSLDWILDDFDIPFPVSRDQREDYLPLRAWIERRRIKDPSRVRAKETGAVAA